jgi:very-short-patch-repair endonuclease
MTAHAPLAQRPSGDAAVAALARRQHGLFTTAQARAAGLSADQIAHRARTGRWNAIETGLWVMGGVRFTWHARVMGACLVTGGAASHRTAAVLHGVGTGREGRPDITVVRRRRVHRSSARVRQSTDLTDADITAVKGIPVTTPARLAIDLGADLPYHLYENAVDDLLARRLLTWDQMATALARLGRRGRPGSAAARRLLLERAGQEVPTSVLERLFLNVVRERALPQPVAQFEIHDAQGFVARVDFAWPAARVAVELDGRRHHIGADVFEADRWKRNRLQLVGWEVLAYTWAHVLDRPGAVAAQITTSLRRACAA